MQPHEERLEYIRRMLIDLRILAATDQLDMLSYLIEMALAEVDDIKRGARPRRVGPPPP